VAFKISSSRKCAICALAPLRAEEATEALQQILADVRDTGVVPHAKDQRFGLLAHRVRLSPFALHYHLKTCMVDSEIQDQRLVELKDLVSNLQIAKAAYREMPVADMATAMTSMLGTFMELAQEIEGQQDPESAVRYTLETVLGPMIRQVLGSVAGEIRELRDLALMNSPPNQRPFVESQFRSSFEKVSQALEAQVEESLKTMCRYYKVELDAKDVRLALSGNTELGDAVVRDPVIKDPSIQ
jgi:hypothetical protein